MLGNFIVIFGMGMSVAWLLDALLDKGPSFYAAGYVLLIALQIRYLKRHLPKLEN